MLRILRIIGIALLLFLTAPVFADIILPSPTNNLPFPNHYFSDNSYEFFNWPARISGWGLGGDSAVGMGDAMLPLVGDDQSMFYTDVQGKYADSRDWFTGLGLGLRWIDAGERIFGAYVFADYSDFVNSGNTPNTNFWFISPGIESMGNLWDFRVNGYIPVSSKTNNLGTTFAENLGINNFVVFQFHQQYDRLFNVLDVIGSGADAEIGREVPGLPPNTRFYLGGYVFSPKYAKTIEGAAVRINCPLTHYMAITAADSYDNVFHNNVEAGIKFTLGGIPDDVAQGNRDISRRMVDPIPRDLASISQGVAQPVVRVTKNLGSLRLVRDNIYFFTTSGGSVFNAANGTQNCTFENPCQAADFIQATIDSLNTIAPNTNFYLNSGTYNPGTLIINNGQSIFGRTPNYVQPASGNGRPLLVSGTTFTALTLLGNNTIDSIRLTAGAGNIALLGVNLVDATNVLISNSQIGDPASPGDFVDALVLQGTSQATVVNSGLSADFSIGGGTIGTFVSGDSQLTLINSTVLSTDTTDAGPAVGVQALGNAQVNISNSSISAIDTDPAGTAIGIQSNNNAQVSVSGSTISANATTADALQQNGASTITATNSRCFENGVEVACTP